MKIAGSVIDTNVIINMLGNNEQAIELLEKIDLKYVPIIVVGELYFGAYNSSRCEENLKRFQEALSHFEILPVNDDVAYSYALIKTDLKKKGTPIPENDIWIAATAHAYKISVATFDEHFSKISQIKVVSTLPNKKK